MQPTWVKISLHNYLILLLISPTDNQVILRTDEPEELLKPALLSMINRLMSMQNKQNENC